MSDTETDTGRCRKCDVTFDPDDKSFTDSTARKRDTPFCRGCAERCHDSEIADHWCMVDEWHSGPRGAA